MIWLQSDDQAAPVEAPLSDPVAVVQPAAPSETVAAAEPPTAAQAPADPPPAMIDSTTTAQASDKLHPEDDVPLPTAAIAATPPDSVEPSEDTPAAVALTSVEPVSPIAQLSESPPLQRQPAAIEPGPAAPSVPSGVTTGLADLHGIEWLRRQPRSSFTIQLLGSLSRSALEKYLVDHQLGDQTAWFTTLHLDRPWFVGVFGIYPTRDLARDAIASLPTTVRNRGPWPRSIEDIVAAARTPPEE